MIIINLEVKLFILFNMMKQSSNTSSQISFSNNPNFILKMEKRIAQRRCHQLTIILIKVNLKKIESRAKKNKNCQLRDHEKNFWSIMEDLLWANILLLDHLWIYQLNKMADSKHIVKLVQVIIFYKFNEIELVRYQSFKERDSEIKNLISTL
jgi:hypothetical protein